ncbi:MAG TPA: hypothetical protein VMT35_04755 [Ignavibacteriaceae bacterium]|nr:hypothetical protein [Ignavibacteriaceae bacterium]
MKNLKFVLALLLISTSIFAQIPKTISYQGLLNDNSGNPKPDGDYTIKFSFYENNAGGDPVWTETKTVSLKKGLFSTSLGDATPFGDLKFDKQYWLGIKVGNEAELAPLIALSSVAYSLSSQTSEFTKNSVTSINQLKDNLTIQGGGGTTVTSDGNVITVSSSGAGSGSGIQGIQNTDNTLTITNPNGPTATVNLKTPLTIPGKLEVTAQDAINVTGYQPFITWKDANAGGMRGIIQSVSGGLNLFTDSYLNKTNSFAYVCLTNNGNLGLGSSQPVSKFEVVAQDAIAAIGYQPFFTIKDANAGYARSEIQGVSGSINLFTESYLNGSNPFSYLHLDNNGNMGIGSSQPVSKFEVVAQDAIAAIGYQPFISIKDANAGYARSVIQGVAGSMNLFTESYLNGSNPTAFLHLDNNGNIGIGNPNPQNKLDVNGTVSTKVLAITGGSDLAEPFDVSNKESIEPGTVMSIDENNPGKLIISNKEYDNKVAGIVSGAGGIKPGITLHQDGVLEGSTLIAISGRVYCKAEALTNPIQVGDLLTTSSIPGYAMKVSGRENCQGTIIGKSMGSLKEGKGLVLVLVNLQ